MVGEGALVPEARCHPDQRTYIRRVRGVKVTCLTPGGLSGCPRGLAESQGEAMTGQKSAEAMVAVSAWRRRAEHEEPHRRGAFDA